jgi:glycosyltransferase involved in cell wall biosynthesis
MRLSENVAAVVIGRNEGERLPPSLHSVEAAGLRFVYVDSGSTDGSTGEAARLRICVVELDPARPFSAARARNEGMQKALQLWPGIGFVMFIDGDCVLDPRFPATAATTFAENPDCAIVTGHLTERHPEASLYNRLCAIEWRGPAGRMANVNGLGGIMMARVSALQDVGGFNEQAIAGEEPDLGVRLMLAGYSLIKIDQSMATHDAQILTFGQWWTRAVRGGHALAHRYARHGHTRFRDGERELVSTLFWGFALPVVVVAALVPTHGLSLLLLAGYGVIAWRVHRYYLRSGVSSSDAWLASRFNIYSRFAHFIGVLRYGINRLRGRFHIIEYK